MEYNKIQECIAGFFFAIFMLGLFGLISISDGFDQHIIESRITQE